MPTTKPSRRATLTCEVCEAVFTVPLSAAKDGRRFCSQACKYAAPRPARRTGVALTCEECSAEFYVRRSRAAKGKARFCSVACHDAHQGRNKTEHTCEVCGEAFRRSPSYTKFRENQRYCSPKCQHADPRRHAMLLAMNEAQQAGKMTSIERIGYALLTELGVEFEQQQTFAGKFTPDATIPSAKMIVQFDGDYWHDKAGTTTEPRVLKRVALDRSQDAYARACGWTVIRMWESDLHRDLTACADRLRKSLMSYPLTS